MEENSLNVRWLFNSTRCRIYLRPHLCWPMHAIKCPHIPLDNYWLIMLALVANGSPEIEYRPLFSFIPAIGLYITELYKVSTV